MRNKLPLILTLSVFLIVQTAPLFAQDSNVKVETKTQTQTQGKKTIFTRITRFTVGSNYKGEKLAGNKAFVRKFNLDDYKAALQSDDLIVLFFYRDGSDASDQQFKEMSEAFDKLEEKNIIGFKANFNDKLADPGEKKLASSFKVASEGTKILIRNGEKLLQTAEKWDRAKFLNELSTRAK